MASASKVSVGVRVEAIGDQAEEDLADPRRGEGRAEFLVDRPVGLDHPLGDDPLARDQSGLRAGLCPLADRQGPARFLVGRQGARCRARRRGSAAGMPRRSARARCRAARGCRWPTSARGRPRAAAPGGRGRCRGGPRIGPPWRSSTVRSSRRSASSRIGAGSLTITGATWSAAACRSLLVLVWLRMWNSATLTRSSRSGRSPIR